MKLADLIAMELDQEAVATRRLLERIPEDKLDWKPHASARTLGELAMHIATNPGAVATVANLDTFEIGSPPVSRPNNRAEILEAFSQSVAQAKQQLDRMDDARATSLWNGTRGGKVVMSLPRIGFVRGILLNHLYHHRGQLSIYLRMLEVPIPSIYGASADEDPFAR